MLNSARKIGTAVALVGAMALATSTPSQAQWFGRGWGWGAPVVAGIGLGLAGAVLAAAGSAYYGGYYGYPAYGYNYGWGYPGYAYGYGYQEYPSSGYGYGGPGVYAGYGWGGYDYGYSRPSYYGASYAYGSPYYRSYTYGSPYYGYRFARRSVGGPVYARARTYTVPRSYAMAPNYRGQRFAHVNRVSPHMVNIAAGGRLTHHAALPRARVVRASGIVSAGVSRKHSVSATATAHRGSSIHSASAMVGA